MEPPPPPPPPPPPKPEKPIEKDAGGAPQPVPKPVDPRVKASKSGLLANLDDLAALRDKDRSDKFAKNQPKTNDPGDVDGHALTDPRARPAARAAASPRRPAAVSRPVPAR
jgi:hypothetical protein